MSNKPEVGNVLKLENPDQWQCDVFEITRPSALNILLIYPPDHTPLHVYFVLIRYFCGPTSWTGANIHIADEEQTLALMRAIHTNPPLSVDGILRDSRLYVVNPVEPKGHQIQILASNNVAIERGGKVETIYFDRPNKR